MRIAMLNLVLATFLVGTIWGTPLQVQVGELGKLQDLLFAPDLIMRNQKVLDLTEEQRQYIMERTQEAQSEFTYLRWDLQSDLQELRQMVEQKAGEEALLKQLDQVLDLERKIKRAQLLLAVQIRNTLNDEQLEKLSELKARRPAAQRRARRSPDQRP